ncbi:ADP-ribosyltransferase [Actinoplanes sp. NPDC051851]|uniref:ADP-ribosyltransferase n=1 Tax=Actinoplanes sp. NPDC051851 TaxID=3154753 RepID=UPI0034331806
MTASRRFLVTVLCLVAVLVTPASAPAASAAAPATVRAASASARAASGVDSVSVRAASGVASVSVRAASVSVFSALVGASCPVVEDRVVAAIDHSVQIDKITPAPVWRNGCGTLYRSDSRGPAIIFAQGFAAKDIATGQYDVKAYVLQNQPSPYVSTTYDHDLYKSWYKSGFNYYIDAPGGVDVNKTIGSDHKYADQLEVAFPGGIRAEYVIGVCPVNKTTKTEIMSDCESNPAYKPWH